MVEQKKGSTRETSPLNSVAQDILIDTPSRVFESPKQIHETVNKDLNNVSNLWRDKVEESRVKFPHWNL